MKKIILIVSLLACFSVAGAQEKGPDKIQKKDKSVIDAIVMEISSREVKYKKFKSPHGAVFSLPTKDVSTIAYADGYIEIMNEPPPVAAKNSTLTAVEPAAKPEEKRESEPADRGAVLAVASGKTSESAILKKEKAAEAKTPKTDVVAKTSKGGYKLSGKQVGLELSPKEVSGLDIDRVALDMLEPDLRHPSEYDGEYQWKSSNSDQKGTVWRIEWDNVTLIPKEWMGYGWQKRANSEKEIKLKNNELRSNGKLMGYFVKFLHKGKEIRGFYVQTNNNRDLFLLKVK